MSNISHCLLTHKQLSVSIRTFLNSKLTETAYEYFRHTKLRPNRSEKFNIV